MINSGINGRIEILNQENVNLEEPLMAIAEPKEGSDIKASPNDENFKGPEPLCVMDSKISWILSILQRHFFAVPYFRHGPGLKIKVHCKLSFNSKGRYPAEENDSFKTPQSNSEDFWPALYAIVITFSASDHYGRIPSVHIPFLMSEPLRKNDQNSSNTSQDENLILVQVQDGKLVMETNGKEKR